MSAQTKERGGLERGGVVVWGWGGGGSGFRGRRKPGGAARERERAEGAGWGGGQGARQEKGAGGRVWKRNEVVVARESGREGSGGAGKAGYGQEAAKVYTQIDSGSRSIQGRDRCRCRVSIVSILIQSGLLRRATAATPCLLPRLCSLPLLILLSPCPTFPPLPYSHPPSFLSLPSPVRTPTPRASPRSRKYGKLSTSARRRGT